MSASGGTDVLIILHVPSLCDRIELRVHLSAELKLACRNKCYILKPPGGRDGNAKILVRTSIKHDLRQGQSSSVLDGAPVLGINRSDFK